MSEKTPSRQDGPAPSPLGPSTDEKIAQARRARGEAQEAAERIARFLEAWDRMYPSDSIYGLGAFAHEDHTRDLLASDIRILLAAVAE